MIDINTIYGLNRRANMIDIDAIRKQAQIPRRTVSELCDEVERLREVIVLNGEHEEYLRKENEELRHRLKVHDDIPTAFG